MALVLALVEPQSEGLALQVELVDLLLPPLQLPGSAGRVLLEASHLPGEAVLQLTTFRILGGQGLLELPAPSLKRGQARGLSGRCSRGDGHLLRRRLYTALCAAGGSDCGYRRMLRGIRQRVD